MLQDLHPTNVIVINSDSHTCTTLLPALQTMGPNRSQIGFFDGRSLGGQVMTAWLGTWVSSNDSCSSFLISVVFIVNVGKGFMIMWLWLVTGPGPTKLPPVLVVVVVPIPARFLEITTRIRTRTRTRTRIGSAAHPPVTRPFALGVPAPRTRTRSRVQRVYPWVRVTGTRSETLLQCTRSII